MKLQSIDEAVALLNAEPDRWMGRYGNDFAIWESGATPRRVGSLGARLGHDLIQRSLVVERLNDAGPKGWIAAKWRKP